MTPDERHRHRSCTVKVRHTTAANAFYASLMIWKVKHGHAWPYSCRYCGGYHTGRIPETVRLFIAELMKSEEFLRMSGFSVTPMRLKVYGEQINQHL